MNMLVFLVYLVRLHARKPSTPCRTSVLLSKYVLTIRVLFAPEDRETGVSGSRAVKPCVYVPGMRERRIYEAHLRRQHAVIRAYSSTRCLVYLVLLPVPGIYVHVRVHVSQGHHECRCRTVCTRRDSEDILLATPAAKLRESCLQPAGLSRSRSLLLI